MKTTRTALAAILALAWAAPALSQDIYHVGRDTGAAANTNQTVLVDPSTGTRIGSTANPLPVTSTSAAAGTPGSAAPAGATQVGGTDGTNLRVFKTDTSGNQVVVGNVAAGAADSGSPVKVGAKYTATLPTLADGARGDLQLGTRGSLSVQLVAPDSTSPVGTAAAADAQTSGVPLTVKAQGMSFNGSTYDRVRNIIGSIGAAGLGVTAVEQAGTPFVNITSATTTAAIKSGAGVFHSLTINTPVASAAITIYDSLTATGTKIATITLPSVITALGPITIRYDAAFATGLTVVTSGATDITVTYR